MKTMAAPSRGFTLVELLVVVSIISILSLIALPNFSEAKTRAQVAAVKNNLRTTAIGFEVINVDTNRYPMAAAWTYAILWRIPFWEEDPDIEKRFQKAYKSLYGPHHDLFAWEILKRYHMQDYEWLVKNGSMRMANGFGFFHPKDTLLAIDHGCTWQNMDRKNWEVLQRLSGGWVLHSPGPDLIEESPGWIETPNERDGCDAGAPCRTYNEKGLFHDYDPTNGTTSYGTIFRTQRKTDGLGVDPQYYE